MMLKVIILCNLNNPIVFIKKIESTYYCSFIELTERKVKFVIQQQASFLQKFAKIY